MSGPETMTPTKILIGRAAVTVSTNTGTFWVSTQWVAYRLGYQNGLGEQWFSLADWSGYAEWMQLT
ncbi:MAG: hypothetical protein COA78_34135 [Blastopirellula sp.]|nr:MAG: hypothetical protein COA78_34135 [Blastopirellula sp.]